MYFWLFCNFIGKTVLRQATNRFTPNSVALIGSSVLAGRFLNFWNTAGRFSLLFGAKNPLTLDTHGIVSKSGQGFLKLRKSRSRLREFLTNILYEGVTMQKMFFL